MALHSPFLRRWAAPLLFVVLAACVTGAFADGALVTVFEQNDPSFDEGRIYPLGKEYLPGIFDLTKFSVSHDDQYTYFDFTFREHDLSISLGCICHQVCQVYVDADRRFYSGSLDTRSDYYQHRANVMNEYPFELEVWVTNFYSALDKQAGYLTPNRTLHTNQPTIKNTTISAAFPKSATGTPRDDWAYTVWCGSDGFGMYRRVDKNALLANAFGGGDDSSIDPNLADILVPSNVNKANIWNMYKTLGKTIVPAVGNDIYMNTVIFNVDDPAGDERGTYPLISGIHPGSFDILNFKVMENPKYIIFRVTLANLSEDSTKQNNFKHLLLHFYVDTDRIFLSGQQSSLPDAGFNIADDKGWEFAVALDGDQVVMTRVQSGSDATTTSVTSGFVVYASNNIVQVSVPKSQLQGLPGLSDTSKWEFIVGSGYSNNHKMLPFKQTASASSFGGGISGMNVANVVDIIDFTNLAQSKILDNNIVIGGGVMSIQVMNSGQLAYFVLTSQTDNSNDERGAYPSASVFDGWRTGGGLFDLTNMQASSDSVNLRIRLGIRKLKSNSGVDGSDQILGQVYIDGDNIFGSGRIDSIGNGNLQVHPKYGWEMCLTFDVSSKKIRVDSQGAPLYFNTLSVQGPFLVGYFTISQLPYRDVSNSWSYSVIVGARQGPITFTPFNASPSSAAFGGGDDGDYDPNVVDILVPQGGVQSEIMDSWNSETKTRVILPAVGNGVSYATTSYFVVDALQDEFGTYPTNPIFSPKQGLFDLEYFTVDYDDSYVYVSTSVAAIGTTVSTKNGMGLLGIQIYIDTDRVWSSGCTQAYLNPGIQMSPFYAWEFALHLSGQGSSLLSANKVMNTPTVLSSIDAVLSGKGVLAKIPISVVGTPNSDWNYVVVSGSVVNNKGKSAFSLRNADPSAFEFGGGDACDYDPNISDIILPPSVDQQDMFESSSMMRRRYPEVSPVGALVSYVYAQWGQEDSSNDERGVYPTNFPKTRGLFDILYFEVGSFQTKLWVRISMSNMVTSDASKSAFDHALISVYINTKAGAPGSQQVLGNGQFTLEDGFKWQYAMLINGEGVTVYGFDSATNTAKILSVDSQVRREGKTIVSEVEWSGLTELDIYWNYVVVSGGHQSGNRVNYCSVSKDAGNDVFGGGIDSNYDSNIVDMLTAPGTSQTEILSGFSEVNKQGVKVGHIGGSVYENIYEAQDMIGDEFGLYPSAPIFKGTKAKGWMDISEFSIRRNATHAEIDVSFSKALLNPLNLKYGFSFPVVSMYTHRTFSKINSRPVDISGVMLESPWVTNIRASGADLRLKYSDSRPITSLAALNASQIAHVDLKDDNTIRVSILIEAIGDPDDSWSYTVMSGLYNQENNDFVLRNAQSSYRFLGGGDDEDFDPNVVDILLPNNTRVAELKKSGVDIQSRIIRSFDTIMGKRAVAPAVGNLRSFDFSQHPQKATESSSSKSNGALIGGVVGGVVGFILIIGLFIGLRYRKKLQVMEKKEKQLFVHVEYGDLEFGKHLGSGSFGDVYSGKWGGTEVAIKKLNFKKMTKEAIAEFNHEVQVMVELRHPNLVLYMGACVKQPNLCIISELMTRGSLYDALHDPTVDIDEHMKISFLMDAARGLQYLHMSNPPILHRDLKSPNLLLDKKWNLKISDFGLSGVKESGPKDHEPIGTLLWMAPEVILGEEYKTCADVYSYGIIIWEIYTRQEPYEGENVWSVALRICNEKFRPTVPSTSDMPKKMQTLMQKCWDQNEAERPSFTTIVNEQTKFFHEKQSSASYSMGGLMTKKNYKFKEEAPTGKLALVFTDVQGSTSLWEHHPEEMSEALSTHNEILRGILLRNKGYEVKTEGDAFMITFSNVKSAVSFAMQSQEMLVSANWPEPILNHKAAVQVTYAGVTLFKGLRVRMGIHFGEPLCKQDPVTGRMDYFGQVVNKAARVGGYPQGGQVAISDAAYDEIREDLDSLGRPSIRDLGEHTLKGITTSTKLYEILPATLADRSRVFAQKEKGDDAVEMTDSSSTTQGHSWQLNFEDISVSDRELGAGSFGVVFLGELRGERVAVKKFMKQKMEEKRYFSFLAEIMLLREVNHPSILKFHGACVKPPNICLVMEFAEHGSLKDVLMNTKVSINDTQRKAIFTQIADAMRYLHQRNPPVIHRDLKSANVMVSSMSPAIVKIGDFGLARVKLYNQTMTKCGTKAWLAPEILKGMRYGEKADVFSFGIMMCEILGRERPYAKEDPLKLNLEIVKGLRPAIPKGVDPRITTLMTQCWDDDEKKRPSFTTIYDQFFSM